MSYFSALMWILASVGYIVPVVLCLIYAPFLMYGLFKEEYEKTVYVKDIPDLIYVLVSGLVSLLFIAILPVVNWNLLLDDELGILRKIGNIKIRGD